MKNINYLYPYWGSEHLSAKEFIKSAKDLGFQGIEINIPEDKSFEKQFLKNLAAIRNSDPHFICVVQQVLAIKLESVDEYISKVLKRLECMLPFKPDFINSQTLVLL
jgi:sugar phosphate isomerase/epimerase